MSYCILCAFSSSPRGEPCPGCLEEAEAVEAAARATAERAAALAPLETLREALRRMREAEGDAEAPPG